MYLVLIWLGAWGFGSAAPAGRRPEGVADRGAAGQGAAAGNSRGSAASANRQTSFDLHARPAQSAADIFTPHSPALGLPTHGVMSRHRTRLAHAENFLQMLGALERAVRIDGRSGPH